MVEILIDNEDIDRTKPAAPKPKNDFNALKQALIKKGVLSNGEIEAEKSSQL